MKNKCFNEGEKMKKSILIIVVLFSCIFTLFAGGFSETKKFDLAKVINIEVDLGFENLTVSTWDGNQIVVVSESNKEGVFPNITSINKTLQIRATDSGTDILLENQDSFCNISLMLPENYLAEKITIKAPYKKLDVKKLNAKTVHIIPGPDNSLANITADYFEIPLPDQADINISNLDCKSFDITLLAGDANITLARAPEKDSKLSVKDGKLNVSIPKASSFTIFAEAYNSKFINNYTGTIDTWARDGVTYKHNDGGPVIKLHTFNGDITIGTK